MTVDVIPGLLTKVEKKCSFKRCASIIQKRLSSIILNRKVPLKYNAIYGDLDLLGPSYRVGLNNFVNFC